MRPESSGHGESPGSSVVSEATASAGMHTSSIHFAETSRTAAVAGCDAYEPRGPTGEYDRGGHVSESGEARTLADHHRGVDKQSAISTHGFNSVSDPSRKSPGTAFDGSDARRAAESQPQAADSIFSVGLSHWVGKAATDSPAAKLRLTATPQVASGGFTEDEPLHKKPFKQSEPDGPRSLNLRSTEDSTAAIPRTQAGDHDVISQQLSSGASTRGAKKARTVRVTKPGQSPVAAYAAKKLQDAVASLPTGSDNQFVEAMEQDSEVPSEHSGSYREYNEQLAKHRAATKALLGSESGWIEDASLLDPESRFILD